MKKKGFTLIELLAVIVILAIITLIIVPVVSNVVNSAKETSFRASVGAILDSATTYLQKYIKLQNDNIFPAVFTCDGTSCKNGEDLLSFEGKVPISGRAVLSEDGALAEYITDGKLCAYGHKWDLEVGTCISLDHTAPIIDENKTLVLTSTTNSITVSFPEDLMYDGETEIEYKIRLYLNGKKIGERDYSNSVTFNNLKNDTEYTVIISCTNQNNLTTTINRKVTTSDIVKPTIAYTNSPATDINGYFNSQTLNVTYTKGNVENPEYYIRSGRTASTNINVIASCGNETIPSECTTVDTNSIEADTWYRVSGSVNVIYNVNATTESSLTAIINDGVNYASSDTKVVAKIDSIPPTVPTITYNSGSNICAWLNNINITLSSTALSGINRYEVDYNDDGVADTAVPANFIPHSGWSSCSNRFRAVSNSGLVSGWTSSVHMHMDTTAPTHTNWWWGEVNTGVARLYIQLTDNVGVSAPVQQYNGHNAGVYCPTSTQAGGYANWVWFGAVWDAGANAYRCDITPATFGHYAQTYITHLYIYDYAGNGGYYNQTSVAIPSLCSFTSQDFAYVGGMQAWAVPAGCSGTYTLEVWGAQGGSPGGDSNAPGGYGGYAAGYASLVEGQILYIGVGGAGSGKAGGFNGGGTSHVNSGGGGGATHIGTINATLAGTPPANVYIVAGGGGGGGYFSYVSNDHWVDAALPGGAGGGTNGSAGTGRTTAAGGGTQSGGYAYGQGGPGTDAGGAAAGGGGWYGGYGASSYDSGGGGGSGYVGAVSSGSMLNGQRAGHGYARITRN